ncbi:MAG: DUF1080 domain-containing protein [Phycisphaerae bacterium]|nr:DUF1080 domain-containing protein [Phycisphaerae bacterium]
MRKLLVILLSIGFFNVSLAVACSTCGCSTPPWENLFNGKDLTGWEQKNGKAKYEAVDGMIVGSTVASTPNSFLCTQKLYGDFILEYDMKCEVGLNSGVQIRSNSLDSYSKGRVHGYQVECDTSNRKYSAGIYDEARRGWLYTLKENKKGQDAFKNGQWNKFRVEAIGSSIRTFLNGVPCANLNDSMTPEGLIALQVHSVGKNKAMVGKTVSWKNIRIITKEPQKYATKKVSISLVDMDPTPNTLTDKEKKEGWKLLWDGKTTRGWRGAKMDGFPAKGWVIKNGELAVHASGGGESAYGGDIVTEKGYRNFELSVDFKLSKGANSGIKYFVDTGLNKGQGSAIGCEFQILDDQNHPDAKLGWNVGSRTVASLYDLMIAKDKRMSMTGWNNARVVVKGAHVEHWLNHIKVLEYERRTPAWRALVAKSKYKRWPNFGEAEEGLLLLQDHGDEVHFRNIKIKELQ